MLRLMKLAVLALMAAVIATPAGARAPEWVVLGEQRVNFLDEGDVIAVGEGEGPFTQIRFDVNGNDLDIRDIKVRFLNGEEQVIRINETVRSGHSSPNYDLNGERRGIKDILLRYNGRPLFGGKAKITVIGQKVFRDDPPPLAGRPAILDTQTVDAASDRIVFRVGRREGPITQIRIRAVDAPLVYRNVEIKFGNGQTQTYDAIERLEPGEQGKAIDLEGDRRFIESVSVQKRPSWRPGAGRAELLGLVLPPPPPPPPPPYAGGRFDVVDTQNVDKAADRITFRVGPRDGRLSQIAIRALDEPILFRNVEIVYANGERQSVDGIDRLEPGQQSRPIDLIGEARLVTEVNVTKRPSWRPGTGRAELLAVRRPAPPPPPPPPMAGGFEVIDQQTIDRRSDKVVFDVERGEGPFSKIKFKALDDGILFRNIQIVFRDGQTQNLDVVERLEPGEESPAIDVEGRGDIEKVIITKRPSWRPGEARLQLAGLERPRGPPPRPVPPPRPSGPPSHGYPVGWVLIGTGNMAPGQSPPPRPFNPGCFANPNMSGCGPVAPLPSRAVIPVGREVGQFSRIGLRLAGGDLQIQSVTVVYGQGERDRVALPVALSNGSHTQPIELKGERFIREIEVEYSKKTLDQSTLEVYGDYADSWIGERGHRRDYNQGWVLLGSQRAQMFSNEVDAFQVGQRFGAFRSVKFVVRKHDVRFYGLRIVYSDGQAEDVPFSGELTDGQSTPPLNLNGRNRYIDRIEMKYRTRLNFHGEGVVEVWGQQ